MSSNWSPLKSSIGQKLVIGITGFLIIGFIIIHLIGNLLLYIGPETYNAYAHALHKNETFVHIFEVILLILFVLHIVLVIKTSWDNYRSRPKGYVRYKSKMGRSKITASSIMLYSGIIVLAFILLHLVDMRFKLRHGVGFKELEPAARAVIVLKDWTSAIVYFFGSIFVGYHVWHAFESVFQTYGLNHSKYTPKIKKISIALAIIFAIGFASFPVWGVLLKLKVIS